MGYFLFFSVRIFCLSRNVCSIKKEDVVQLQIRQLFTEHQMTQELSVTTIRHLTVKKISFELFDVISHKNETKDKYFLFDANSLLTVTIQTVQRAQVLFLTYFCKFASTLTNSTLALNASTVCRSSFVNFKRCLSFLL